MKRLLLTLTLVALSSPRPASAHDEFLTRLAQGQSVLVQAARDAKTTTLVPQAASRSSKAELWMNSIEYAALRFQNGWRGWDASMTGGVPHGIAWMRSEEYEDLCQQSYAQAWVTTMRSSRSKRGDLAVVMDLDEAVIDNIQYQIERGGADYSPDSWDAWVGRREAGTVPGAKAFIDMVRSLGPRVHLVHITDRTSAQEASTVENLIKNGLYQSGDLVLTRKDKADTKKIRRDCVEAGRTGTDARCGNYEPMTIIAQVGDSIRDFYEVYGRDAAKSELEAVTWDTRWGSLFFILPNPMYGQWERNYK